MLFEIENKTFHTINELLNKQKKTKKIHIQIKQSLNVSKTNALQSLKNEICIEETNMSKNNNRTKKIILHVQHYNKCNQPKHNARTCELKSVVSKEKNDI